MQNTLIKKLTTEDILNYYLKGESDKQTVGLEYERISLNKKSFKQADFQFLFEIIKSFSKNNNFKLIYDNETIIGAKNNEGTLISLEPGGQFEISLSPKESLFEIKILMENYLKQIDEIGKKYGIEFFAIGNNPKNCYQNIEILNKRRYKIMAEYLFKKGKFAPVMMRETAGVQVNIDYKNHIDAKRKIKAAAYISPFLTGFFANSPFRNNKLTKYKSFRALAWKYTGAERCNLFYKDIIDKNGNIYEQYANYILDVPMIFTVKNDEYIKLNGKVTFREFMKNNDATIEDYINHQSLCFPDIRLKNCIEIRNHDSQNLDVAVGICAIYKGILYSNTALDEILDFFAPLNSNDLEELGFLAAKFGINYKVKKLNLKADEIIRKILYLAQDNLDIEEKYYLEFLIDLATEKKCIADLLLEGIK